MTCRQAERSILRSLDRDLGAGAKSALDAHLRDCSRCRALQAEHVALRDALRQEEAPDPRPFFVERLRARLEALELPAPAAVWQKWCLRAIPVSLFLIGVFVGGLLFMPPSDEAVNASEALLLRGSNPISETSSLFDETRNNDKNVMIIFATDERTPERRPRP